MRLTSSVGEFSTAARRVARPFGILALALALTACGGGGGSDAATGNRTAGADTPGGASNAPPSISGSPASAASVGQLYSFAPSASDPEGAKLAFSVTGLPAWAAFDASTGKLTGTAKAGTYSNIVISVSDGTNSVSLKAFTITVGASSGTGSATLAWSPPTAREDGSTLTNLSGYKIYYGTDENDLSSVVSLNTAGLASYTIDGLGSGTYYFSVTAVDSTGTESQFSSVVSKTIG